MYYLLLSALHNTVHIDPNNPKDKPETVQFYNFHVWCINQNDVVDPMVRRYNC